jgi:signal transduction histidine kinase
MNLWQRSSTLVNRLIDVPTADPDDARRRKLLNIILVSMAGIAVLTMIVGALSLALAPAVASGIDFVFPASIATLVGVVVFYFINRYRSGVAASILFLLFLSMVLALADTPAQLANGRSLFLFAIPIIVASVLLGPVASFAFYILVSIELIVLSLFSGEPINFVAIVSFLFLSIIAWLSARSLEQALKDLRKINANLDQEVADRTRALSQSLQRERVQAGRNQAILDSIADGVIVFDGNGEAIVANPAISRLTEVPIDHIIGATIGGLLAAGGLPARGREAVRSLLDSPTSNALNVRVEWGRRVLSASAAQVLDSEGEQLGRVAVFRDFTREAEVERLKNAFVGIVSHELRTPLNAISGYAEMLQEGVYGSVSDEQQNILGRVMTNTRRLLYIVNDLLDQAQIEAGKLAIRQHPCRPAELVQNVWDLMSKVAGDHGLALNCTVDPDLPPALSGDATRLEQIMVNLVNNAIKFTERGAIDLRAYRVNSQYWAIEVRDTGQGISEGDRQTIFDAFEQADTSSAREHGGVGLGLSIVKNLATLMGGMVTLESTIAQGSTFTVTLPLVAVYVEAGV